VSASVEGALSMRRLSHEQRQAVNRVLQATAHHGNGSGMRHRRVAMRVASPGVMA
jgi:hypothetical protein